MFSYYLNPPIPHIIDELETINGASLSCVPFEHYLAFYLFVATDNGLVHRRGQSQVDPIHVVETGRSHDVDASGTFACVATESELQVVQWDCDQ